MTPEEKARTEIDARLTASGWRVSVVKELKALVSANLQRASRLRQSIL